MPKRSEQGRNRSEHFKSRGDGVKFQQKDKYYTEATCGRYRIARSKVCGVLVYTSFFMIGGGRDAWRLGQSFNEFEQARAWCDRDEEVRHAV